MPLYSAVVCVDVLVCKLHTRRGRLNIAVVYRPPISSLTHGICVAQFCSQFTELLDELLALPGQLVFCGEFDCPGGHGSVDVVFWTCWSHAASHSELTSPRLLALPGQLVLCGEFDCPNGHGSVDVLFWTCWSHAASHSELTSPRTETTAYWIYWWRLTAPTSRPTSVWLIPVCQTTSLYCQVWTFGVPCRHWYAILFQRLPRCGPGRLCRYAGDDEHLQEPGGWRWRIL